MDLVPHPVLPANIAWSAYQMRRALNQVGLSDPEYVFIDQPLFPVKGLSDATVIFRPTDVFIGRHLQRAARAVIRRADGIAATSPGVLASLDDVTERPSAVIENGVEFARFAAISGTPKEYDFVYVGALDHRFDFRALKRAAERLAGSEFAIYGPTPASHASMPANVHLLGPIPYEQVPRAMASGRIGIMPFVAGASNSGRSPMKLYEYIAAGLPVIAPSEIARRASRLVGLASYESRDEDSFAETAEMALSGLVLSDGDLEIARSKDWSSIAVQLLEFADRASSEHTLEPLSP
jgi:teichuronic acid biosynthesis glycosyltransferase TuaH